MTSKKSNKVILNLISELKKASYENKTKIWKDIAKRIEKSAKNLSEVNLYKIDKYAMENEYVIVPGKVLGVGNINKPLIISALNCSKTAKNKILQANGKIISIRELLNENPSGRHIKIIG